MFSIMKAINSCLQKFPEKSDMLDIRQIIIFNINRIKPINYADPPQLRIQLMCYQTNVFRLHFKHSCRTHSFEEALSIQVFNYIMGLQQSSLSYCQPKGLQTESEYYGKGFKISLH